MQNKKINIKIHKIGNTEYVLAEDLNKHFNEIRNYSDNKIFLNNAELKFSVGSFFIVYESKEKMKVHQMPSPPIDYNGRIYLPLIGLFKAFGAFDVFNVEFRENNIFVNSEMKINNVTERTKQEEKAESNVIPDADESDERTVIKDILIKRATEQPVAGEKTGTNISETFYSVSGNIMQYFNYRQTEKRDTFRREEYPPGIYLLPQNLKRNQNIKNNKEGE